MVWVVISWIFHIISSNSPSIRVAFTKIALRRHYLAVLLFSLIKADSEALTLEFGVDQSGVNYRKRIFQIWRIVKIWLSSLKRCKLDSLPNIHAKVISSLLYNEQNCGCISVLSMFIQSAPLGKDQTNKTPWYIYWLELIYAKKN